jgi:hypothetical protein
MIDIQDLTYYLPILSDLGMVRKYDQTLNLL